MKARPSNPFHPQFGKRPDKFVGRDGIIREFLASLEERNDPYRNTVVVGIRGSGKTALLSGIKEAIDPQTHLVVDVTAGAELNQSILDQMQLQLKLPEHRLTGGSAGALGFSLGLQTSLEESAHGFWYHLTLLVEECQKRRLGIVFLIDEVHNETPDTREFVTAYQHLVRDNADVALLMAGLPRSVNSVLNDKVLTFLHRTNKVTLGSIDALLVRRLYETTFADAGFEDVRGALPRAADATCGFPYLIQLIGFYLWKSAGSRIDERLVADALLNSKVELFQNVYQLMLGEASPKDQEFLCAMLKDAAASQFGELAKRMGTSASYASRYRQRLIDSGLVHSPAYGKLAFAPPYFREFLQARVQGDA
jgi:DNA-binding Lrp family transcriptional regulator